MQNAYAKKDGRVDFISWKEQAWHKTGHVYENPIYSATEGYGLMMGDEQIIYKEYPLVPMLYNFTDGSTADWNMLPEYLDADSMDVMDSKHKAIYQYDGNGKPIGLVEIVSKKWRLITPQEACEIWDKAMADLRKEGYQVNPIETMGFLNGKNKTADRFWIATKERPIEIKGDEIRLYVTVYISMDSDSTLMIVLTPVRTVCENTWKAGIASLTRKIQIAHSAKAPQQLHDAIQTAYLGLPEGVLGLQEWLNSLANAKMSEAQAESFFEHVFKFPTEPRKDYHGATDKGRQIELWEQKVENLKRVRAACLAGFSGGSMDWNDTPDALHYTAYDAFQQVTQYATYSSTSKSPIRSIMEPTGTHGLEIAEAEKWLTKFAMNPALVLK